ncbi:MAG: lysylphosphatidylglycerol synthase transmembrane domain-containing protein [Candidatus Hodarchaeales archaeon]
MESQTGMEFSEERISLRKVFDKKTLILLGFAAFVLIMYFILEDINIFDIVDTFLSANWILLVIGASFAFIAVLLDTLTWKLLLSISSIRPPTLATYRIQLSSFAYGLLIPSAGAVEAIMRVIMGTQEFVNEDENRNATTGEILSSVVVHKLLGLLAFIPISVFIAFSMFDYISEILVQLNYDPLPRDFNIVFIVLISLMALLIIALFVLIAINPNKAKGFLSSLLIAFGRFPLIGKHTINAAKSSGKVVDDFSVQFAYLARNKVISVVALGLSFLSQVTHWVSILFILLSISIPISLDQVAAINFLGGTVDLIPLGIPGMAGLKEITLSVFIEVGLGISTNIAISGAILVQLIKFYLLIIVGLVVYVIGKTRVTAQKNPSDSNKIGEEKIT